MYTDFYELKEKPFALNPSPRFLYLSEGHKEALALLRYGVMERKGFILLTGEVGTGKTTVVRALLESLDTGTRYIYISNPLLKPEEFISYLAYSAFKEKLHFKSKADFLIGFENLLKEHLQHQKPFLLIIDEAQDLSLELLEEIRLLSNMEYADEKLVNIFLVGQPELNEKLNAPESRALLQRISHRYDIPPLDAEGTRQYISTRLKIAGAKNEGDVFNEGAIGALHRFSGGYPRKINVLADNALLIGYGQGKRRITAGMVEQSYHDSPLSVAEGPSRRPSPAEAREDKGGAGSRRIWKWAAVVILVLLFLFGAWTATGRGLLSQVVSYLPMSSQTSPGKAPVGQALRKKIDLSPSERSVGSVPGGQAR